MKLKLFIICISLSIILSNKLMKPGCKAKPQAHHEITFPIDNTSGTPLSDTCVASLDKDFKERDALEQYEKACESVASTWGPNPLASNFKHVTAPKECDSVLWAHQRLLKVVDNFVKRGYNYCHHHAGSWIPPNNDKMRQVINICPLGDPTAAHGTCSSGRSGVWNGIDCSHYTSWVYLYGFGMYLNTNVGEQGCGKDSPGKLLSETRDDQDKLLPGDLIYLSNKGKDKITHVILWTGIKVDFTNPTSPFGSETLLNNVPDCQRELARKHMTKWHAKGQTVYVISDSHWNGPNYRPFAGWWYNAFSHAKRIINASSSLPQNPTNNPAYCKKH